MRRGRSANPGRLIAAQYRAEVRAAAYCGDLRARGVVPTVARLMRAHRYLFRSDAERIVAEDAARHPV